MSVGGHGFIIHASFCVFLHLQVTLLCDCDTGFSGKDCSAVSGPFSIHTLTPSTSLDPFPLSRTGQTVVHCNQRGFILFGGLSPRHGVLEDVWRFDGFQWQRLDTNGCK